MKESDRIAVLAEKSARAWAHRSRSTPTACASRGQCPAGRLHGVRDRTAWRPPHCHGVCRGGAGGPGSNGDSQCGVRGRIPSRIFLHAEPAGRALAEISETIPDRGSMARFESANLLFVVPPSRWRLRTFTRQQNRRRRRAAQRKPFSNRAKWNYCSFECHIWNPQEVRWH